MWKTSKKVSCYFVHFVRIIFGINSAGMNIAKMNSLNEYRGNEIRENEFAKMKFMKIMSQVLSKHEYHYSDIFLRFSVQ